MTTGVAAPSAALVVLLFWWCRQQGLAALDAGLIAGGYGLATPAFPFATMLFGHQTAAAFLFAAFVLCWLVRRGRGGARTAVAAGLLTGMAIVSDYPAALAVAPFGLYLLTSSTGRRLLPAMAIGGIFGLSPLLAYNYASFGNPFRLAYEQIDDPASFSGATRGIFGVTTPNIEALVEILFSAPGLFARAPFLLLAPFGLLAMRDPKRRADALALGGGVLLFLAFNAAYYLPFGGVQTGPRFFLPALPFLAALLAFCRPVAIRLLAPLIAVSGLVAFSLTAVRVKVPNGLPEGAWDLPTYWLPRLAAGDVALNWGSLRYGLDGLAGLLPLLVVVLAAVASWLLLRTRQDGARSATVGVALVAYCLVSLPVGLPAAGRVPAVFRQTQPLPADAAPVMRFGDAIGLLSTEVRPLDARLDSDLHVTLRWTALAPVTESYTVFVHVLDPAGTVIGQWDSPPGAGAYPTLLWQPGQQVNDSYVVRLRRDVPLPTVATVNIGLYRYATLERLPATSPSGEPYGDAPEVARLRLAGPAIPAPAGPPLATFGEQLDLFAATEATSSGTISGILRWRARTRLEKDYHVSVQVVGPNGLVAQRDARLTERYPTTAWQPGEVVEQPFSVDLPPEQASPWRLIVVVYDPASGARLPTQDGDAATLRTAP